MALVTQPWRQSCPAAPNSSNQDPTPYPNPTPSHPHPCSFDWARTARFAFFAGSFGGPVGHYWYKFLDAVSADNVACCVALCRAVRCWVACLAASSTP